MNEDRNMLENMIQLLTATRAELCDLMFKKQRIHRFIHGSRWQTGVKSAVILF